jgi:BirA family transcriptional regulator, biotin operon repressor / biotin---[acetyl-CoA-carboxylase] ligase
MHDHLIQENLEPLNEEKIRAALDEKAEHCVGLALVERVTSTNDYLKNIEKQRPFTVVMAEQQTQGRGRLGRAWYSPLGQNIYCSLHYRLSVNQCSGLSLIVALATVRALSQLECDLNFSVKWPNDIFVHDKKLGGILIELHHRSEAIIGIGINCNMNRADPINQPWISLQQVTGTRVDRNQLAAFLINQLIDYLKKFEALGFCAFQSEWLSHDYLSGKIVTLTQGNRTLTGVASGVNDQGQLLVKFDRGIESFSSAGVLLVKSK